MDYKELEPHTSAQFTVLVEFLAFITLFTAFMEFPALPPVSFPIVLVYFFFFSQINLNLK